MKKVKKNIYVDSDDLEKCWAKWLETEDPQSWEELTSYVYKICKGVAVHFNPKDDEEHTELCHETFVLTIEKIRNRKLTFEPGRAPVFNLLTTTIFRHLYSLKNKSNRRKKLLRTKFALKPEVLDRLVAAAGINGDIGGKHPDSSRIKSSLFSQLDEPGSSTSIKTPD